MKGVLDYRKITLNNISNYVIMSFRIELHLIDELQERTHLGPVFDVFRFINLKVKFIVE